MTDDMSIEDKLRGAIDCASFELDCREQSDDVSFDVYPLPGPDVGTIYIHKDNASITLNDGGATTIDESLSQYNWETGTIRLDDGKMALSVWEDDS